ncbi:PREDICTED: uncharacterized protein LOC101309177 [Fragaria vesca subsp. vesca]|uniref:uncharacterized protein LOC101309177 n=1 Tax=Fragaria vesca subsp. vesca TaxID=101020 RepID=UPI0002C33785|nr:PREDICTED: uncharacterized protein LOC101309177 [Fragaria vesca subsp. vesca]
MACKLPSISASAVTAAALVAAAASPTLVIPSDLHPDLITTDAEDQSILESIAQDVVDVVFACIADESGDGELRCVLHLNYEIFEAEEIYGPPGTGKVFRDEAVEVTGVLEDVTNVAEEAVSSGHGDCEEAGDFFDCFEGVGIAMKDGFVEARRRSF